jgi:hypothetical protein
MAEKIKGAKEKLGEEKYKDIIEKDWKVAELPTEEELAKEPSKNPKTRSNINSRKNLVQYRKKTPEQKEKIIKNLKFVEKEEDIDPHSILGGFSRLDDLLKLLPVNEVFSDRKEQELYYNYIKLILQDFDANDLTSSDIDDITTLGANRVYEYRLLKASRQNPAMVLEATPSVEKFRRSSEKLKGNLANRRVDRVDPRKRSGISIVELVDYLDAQKDLDFQKRMDSLEEERLNYKPANRDSSGKLITNEW